MCYKKKRNYPRRKVYVEERMAGKEIDKHVDKSTETLYKIMTT